MHTEATITTINHNDQMVITEFCLARMCVDTTGGHPAKMFFDLHR
jgi:hypothetical protein